MGDTPPCQGRERAGHRLTASAFRVTLARMTVPAGSSVPGAAASTCSRCQESVPAGARFCPGCGRRLGAPAESGRLVSPHAYAPAHLAERMRTGAAALEGERKQVTVLFADVKGSMDLAEQLDPEEWSQIMRRSASAQAERLAKDTSP